jgi:hypothetical protein
MPKQSAWERDSTEAVRALLEAVVAAGARDHFDAAIAADERLRVTSAADPEAARLNHARNDHVEAALALIVGAARRSAARGEDPIVAHVFRDHETLRNALRDLVEIAAAANTPSRNHPEHNVLERPLLRRHGIASVLGASIDGTRLTIDEAQLPRGRAGDRAAARARSIAKELSGTLGHAGRPTGSTDPRLDAAARRVPPKSTPLEAWAVLRADALVEDREMRQRGESGYDADRKAVEAIRKRAKKLRG